MLVLVQNLQIKYLAADAGARLDFEIQGRRRAKRNSYKNFSDILDPAKHFLLRMMFHGIPAPAETDA